MPVLRFKLCLGGCRRLRTTPKSTPNNNTKQYLDISNSFIQRVGTLVDLHLFGLAILLPDMDVHRGGGKGALAPPLI